jgi:L-alanine-DL-glutamate epimerase-like enolase superfamily enzyme
VKLQIRSLEARLRAPMVSSRDSVSARPLMLVSLEAADGATGFGEAAPLEGYDGVRIDDVRAALEDCRAVIGSSDGEDRDVLLAACAERAVLPQALAAIDLALWDLAGRRAGQPVWRLLGAERPPTVEVNATIASPDRAGACAAVAAAREAGFACVKVKVGLGDDAGRLAAVRAVGGRELAIRLDANGAWSVPEALAALRALEPVGIECCEEPVSGLAAVAELETRTLVPISIDETADAPGALDVRVCDAVCLKVARSGGISRLIERARRARAAGYEVYLASTLDGPLGIAAALHAAAVIAPDRPCGLATLAMFDGPADPLPPAGGRIAAPAGPGLGDGLPGWYEALRDA